MVRTTDITSFTELRKNLRGQLDRVRGTGRPLFVTNNGQTEAVVLSPEAFDELQDLMELRDSLEAIRRSEEQFRQGQGVEAGAAIRDIAANHGLKLDR
jgi:prevent-host-death family protein